MTRTTRVRHYSFLFLLGLFAFFVNLGQFEVSVAESRNLRSAQEILSSGQWMVPTFNGSPRLAKPPLPTWCCALVGKLTGDSENLAMLRLPVAVMALLLLLFFYEFLADLVGEREDALLGSAVLATCGLTLTYGRICSWNLFSVSLMMGAVWLLWRALHRGSGHATFATAGLLAGLSFMSKGPFAFVYVLFPFLLSYLFVFGRERIAAHVRGLALAAVVCFAMSAWWPLYAKLHYPESFSAMVGKETWSWFHRYVHSLFHYKYFPYTLGVWVLSFGLALTTPLGLGFKNQREERTWYFSFCWLATGFAIMCLVPEKKYRYLLPLVIPAAILIAGRLRALRDRHSQAEYYLHSAALFFAMLVCGAPLLIDPGENDGLAWLLLAGGVLYSVTQIFRSRLSFFLYGSLLLSVLISTVLIPRARDAVFPERLHPNLREIRHQKSLGDLPMCHLGNKRDRPVFLTGRNLDYWVPHKGLPLPARPLAVISYEPTDFYFREYLKSDLEIVPIGIFEFDRLPIPRNYYLSIVKDKEKQATTRTPRACHYPAIFASGVHFRLLEAKIRLSTPGTRREFSLQGDKNVLSEPKIAE